MHNRVTDSTLNRLRLGPESNHGTRDFKKIKVDAFGIRRYSDTRRNFV